MATVYRTPSDFPPAPEIGDFFKDGHFDSQGLDEAENKWIAQLTVYARNHNKGDLVGEVVRFPAADGYAVYMIWSHKPCALIHLPIGDAWSIPDAHARGLRISDLRQQVTAEKRLAAAFEKARANK